MMKKFTHVNEGFVCEVCGFVNLAAQATCRNHCIKCLCSKHVDVNPGDRAEKCGGIMKPIDIEIHQDELTSIVFRCSKCGKEGRNKIASDDDRGKLFEVLEKKA